MEVLEKTAAAPSLRKKLDYDDFVRLTPPDSGNYELHDGKIIEMASPTPSHQRAVRRINRRMENHVEAHRLGELFFAPMDVVFDPRNTFQPDLLFISKERREIVGDKKIEGAPDLVVEVLSESNTQTEMSYKKHIYESSLVAEYWLVNLKKRTLTIYRNIDGELLPKKIYAENEVAESDVLTGFSIAVADVFEVVDAE